MKKIKLTFTHTVDGKLETISYIQDELVSPEQWEYIKDTIRRGVIKHLENHNTPEVISFIDQGDIVERKKYSSSDVNNLKVEIF